MKNNKASNSFSFRWLFALCFALFVVVGSGVYVWNTYDVRIQKKIDDSIDTTPTPASILSEYEAKKIAETSCIKGGEALRAGSYNAYTGTWWFDANLNATREGCNPACVVDETTKTAEINWRCTGARPQEEKPCGIENCHGLDIVCGPNPAQMCTEMYQLGDKCRQFAECGIARGTCQQVDSPRFSACKTCVQTCEREYRNDPEQAFFCESTCTP